MRIGIIQASSQKEKNHLLYETTCECAKGHEVINFGCYLNEQVNYSYMEISVAIGLLLASGSFDFVITGCSSGQGMMLACNSMPGVICGYAPSPRDAYLFAQINNGNAISLPLGEDYTWKGTENCKATIQALFSEPFGQGYPREEAERKLKDTELLKKIRKESQVEMVELLEKLNPAMTAKVSSKLDVVNWILKKGNNENIISWLRFAIKA